MHLIWGLVKSHLLIMALVKSLKLAITFIIEFLYRMQIARLDSVAHIIYSEIKELRWRKVS